MAVDTVDPAEVAKFEAMALMPATNFWPGFDGGLSLQAARQVAATSVRTVRRGGVVCVMVASDGRLRTGFDTPPSDGAPRQRRCSAALARNPSAPPTTLTA